ncbi:MAG: polysaccharide deacetylase family protein [Acidobacteriales bacterium]|nr:polysaccharide deacetylase family protein [Terriglobales bacterium]
MKPSISLPPKGQSVYLMYHELELSGRALSDVDPGYVRYVLPVASFKEQIKWLQAAGVRGASVEEARSHPDESAIVITFDDGCETDLIAAAPVLKEAGFGATFYITVGFLGKPGYMSRTQLRELGDLGFDIGSHSMTHPYLSDLSDQRLREEIGGSKIEIEQITGREVHHFSCPGGRWSPRVAEIARELGYHTVTTSHASANGMNTDPFCLGRFAIMRGTTLAGFQQICQGKTALSLEIQTLAGAAIKRLLGNSGYDRLRSLLLRLSSPTK